MLFTTNFQLRNQDFGKLHHNEGAPTRHTIKEDNLQFGQCGSEAEQSQTVASAVMISGCVVQLPYFPPPLSPSLNRTQRLSAAAVAGMIKQDLLVILSPSLLLPQRQVHSTSERSESRRACELCQR